MVQRVRVQFTVEPTDQDDPTGVSNTHYEKISKAIMDLGGDDISIELVEAEDDPHEGKRAKKGDKNAT